MTMLFRGNHVRVALLLCAGVVAVLSPLSAAAQPRATAMPMSHATVSLSGGGSNAIAVVDTRYVSVTTDSGQLAGHFWNSSSPFPWTSPALRNATRALTSTAPTLMRIGGTDGDSTYYNVTTQTVPQLPKDYSLVIDEGVADALCAFAADTGIEGIVFGINAGAGPRDQTKSNRPWQGANAEALMRYFNDHHPGCVLGWELGNEPNLFPFAHGLDATISGAQLAKDYAFFANLSASINASWAVNGIDTAWQIPLVGEFLPIFTDFMKAGGADSVSGAITYHWYPQESPTCPLGGFPVTCTPETAIKPATLAADEHWTQVVVNATRAAAPAGKAPLPVWLGEMAECSCGGLVNVTNAWAGTFYYLAKLGGLSEQGVSLVARQTLWASHSGYALLEGGPSQGMLGTVDFWAAMLFKQLMGPHVLATDVAPTQPAASDSYLRVHARCAAAGVGGADGAVSLLVLNLNTTAALQVSGDLLSSGARRDFVVTAAAQQPSDPTVDDAVLTSAQAKLNGEIIGFDAGFSAPKLQGVARTAAEPLVLPPLSYAFTVLDDAAAAACKA